MMLLQQFVEAIHTLRSHPLRSALAVIGMFVAIVSIVTVFGLSSSAAQAISGRLSGDDEPTIQVSLDDAHGYEDSSLLTFHDVDVMRRRLAELATRVEPGIFLTDTARGDHTSVSVFIVGSDGLDAANADVSGRTVTTDDVTSAARVCVVSDQIASRLFGGDALGRRLRLGSGDCRVIGVQRNAGSLFSALSGAYVVVPYSLRSRSSRVVQAINIWGAAGVSTEQLGAHIREALTEQKPRGAYSIVDAKSQLASVDRVVGSISIGLGALGALSLIVAGMGIANVMLISIAERTREIGIRRAIGARRGVITAQLLAESILIATIGGGAGLLTALAVVAFGNRLIENALGGGHVNVLLLAGIAAIFSIGTGAASGIVPALRAGGMSPIEALRS